MHLATDALAPGRSTKAPLSPDPVLRHATILKESVMYEKPAVQRFGTLRDITQGLGPALGGDPQSVYHRS
jgi:hypothetical protein